MKSRWSICLVLMLMLCLPLQGMASVITHCVSSTHGQASHPVDMMQEAESPCHEMVDVEHDSVSLDEGSTSSSCAACDMHCTVLALPFACSANSLLPSMTSLISHNDPARYGVVLDALTRPPISFLL